MRRTTTAIALIAIAALAATAAWLLMRPQTITVAGRNVEVRLAGTGSPAVIFESGFEGGLFLEAPLQDRIARATRTLSYERAGIGHSNPGPDPRNGEQIARELHQLLAAAHLPPPYVLVGHSAGALYVRVFAHLYPREIAGLVFVDPATEDFYDQMRETAPADWAATSDTLRKLGPKSGLWGQWRFLPQTFAQARQAWPLPAVPSVLLMSTKPLGQWPLKTMDDVQALHRSQAEMALRIPGIRLVPVAGSDHLSILSAPATGREILAILDEARHPNTVPRE